MEPTAKPTIDDIAVNAVAALTTGRVRRGVESSDRTVDMSDFPSYFVAQRSLPAAILAVKNHTSAAWPDIGVDMPAHTARAFITTASGAEVLSWTVLLPRPLTDAESDAVMDWLDGKENAERESCRANAGTRAMTATEFANVVAKTRQMGRNNIHLTVDPADAYGDVTTFVDFKNKNIKEVLHLINTPTFAGGPQAYPAAASDPNAAMIARDGAPGAGHPAQAKASTPTTTTAAAVKPAPRTAPPLPVADITRTGTHFGRWGAGL